MRLSNISPFVNNWSDVFDFTPNKENPDKLNYTINKEANFMFSTNLKMIEELYA